MAPPLFALVSCLFSPPSSTLATHAHTRTHTRPPARACAAQRILRREGELKAREEKRCSGAVAEARGAEMDRNRARVKELLALGEACAGKVQRALLGESGIELSSGSGGLRRI